MFTRTELELLAIPQLKILCHRYGLRLTGSAAHKENYITTLMAFPTLALQQLEQGRGLRRLSFTNCENIGIALDEINTPTLEQSALIRISLENRRMEYPHRYQQERLLALWRAKNYLEQAIDLLGMQ
nr:hypothetical protein [Fortiea contorta]